MSAASNQPPTAEGPGSVFEAPHLPAGFTVTFASRHTDSGELYLHAVIGGNGHRVAEEAPEEVLTGFPVPYREYGGGLR